jgi:hypothetical protein
VAQLNFKEWTDVIHKQTMAIQELWKSYATTCLIAGGFTVFFAGAFNIGVAIAVTIGFLTFATGNWFFIQQELRGRFRANKYITDHILIENDEENVALRECFVRHNNMIASAVVHLVIDLCVVAAIWSRAMSPHSVPG